MPTISIDQSHLSERDAHTRVQSYPIVYVFTKPIICDFQLDRCSTASNFACTRELHASYSRVACEFHACTHYLVGELYRTVLNTHLSWLYLLAMINYPHQPSLISPSYTYMIFCYSRWCSKLIVSKTTSYSLLICI